MKIDSSNPEALREYYSELSRIQDENAATYAVLLPSTEKIYEINLKTRIVEKPSEFTIVESDHVSETVYFKVPRYFDNVDLSTTVCIIEYINAKNEGHIYAVPYYDIDHLSVWSPEDGIDEPMMLIPWRIAGTAAAKAGELKFAFRFYTLDEGGSYLTYNLNTIPQTMTINPGIGIDLAKATSEDKEKITEDIKRSYDEFFHNAFLAAQEGKLTWMTC